VAALGNVAYYGPDVAAMTPMQMSAGQGINTAAGAFGLGANDLSMGMPAPQTFAGGVQGYSSGDLYDQALRELQMRSPAQYDAITGMFINPQTGAVPLSFGQNVPAMARGARSTPLSFGGGGGGPGNDGPAEPMGGLGRNINFSGLASNVGSYLPGGVNSRDGLISNVAGAVRNTISPQGAPTAANRPVARPR
jgi:hypothetical protein